MSHAPRRQFLKQSLCLGAAALAGRPLAALAAKPGSRMRSGTVAIAAGLPKRGRTRGKILPVRAKEKAVAKPSSSRAKGAIWSAGSDAWPVTRFI